MLQAMCIASVMEFTGALGVGARVAETIRTKIVDPELYTADPAVLMLGMACAVIGSSLYLTMATRIGLPVSTTHTIMGGVIGMGIASVGADRISWGWNGVAQVFAAWAIAPGISGGFGAIIFLLTKYGVMRAKEPVKRAFFSVPLYFIVTASLLASKPFALLEMRQRDLTFPIVLIIWKGASSKIDLDDGGIAGVIIGVGFGVGLLVVIFFLPYLWRKVVCDDWQLKWWHIPLGPLLLKRGEVPPRPADYKDGMIDYYAGYATKEGLEAQATAHPGDVEHGDVKGADMRGTDSDRIHHDTESGEHVSVSVSSLWSTCALA
jgi:PiT family inorganic phosphate transporter/sodium-dependent phosphate transporter